MVAIVAENAEVEKEIQNLLDILVDAGSGFHSQLLIYEKGGGLSIKTTEPMEFGKEIIRLPRTVLMPGDQYSLDVKEGAFVVTYPDHSIATDLQRRVINKMYEIYNLTNKVDLHEKYSFLLSLKNSPDLLDKLAEGREFVIGAYKDWLSWIKAGMTDEQYRKILYETYVKTRPLGYSDPVRESSVSMIMPVLDFMNHHWEGGSFAVGQGVVRKGDLVMHTSQPFKDSTECYANYGILDAFDALVRYDFIDKAAPILRSVCVDLEGPAGDVIHIKNHLGFVYKKELKENVQDLRRYIPDISFKDDQTVVSHILLPADKSKFALVRVLNIILETYNGRHAKKMGEKEGKIWRKKAQEKIIEKNNAYYRELLGLIDALPKDHKDSFGVLRVRDMAYHQMEKLKAYQIQ